MSKLEEYRKWCSKHYRESVGFDLADPAIAELEAENKSQVEKTIEARQETHLAIIQKREAEAERDQSNTSRLALAQLVAQYKWQREIQVVGALDYNGAIARLDELWESHLREEHDA